MVLDPGEPRNVYKCYLVCNYCQLADLERVAFVELSPYAKGPDIFPQEPCWPPWMLCLISPRSSNWQT